MPIRPIIVDYARDISQFIGNPSSIHNFGRRQRSIIEQSRDKVGDYIGINPDRIIFTSGATESNNMILSGFKGHIIISAIEHPSILNVRGDNLICPVDKNGIIKIDHLEELLKNTKKPTLVAVMAANNEIGIIQPIQQIAEIVHTYDGLFLCDGTQALTKENIPWDLCDFITFSSHKIGGLPGTGILVTSPKIKLEPLMKGGGQEKFRRPGTENFLSIAAFAKAIDISQYDNWKNIEKLRDSLESQIQSICNDALFIGKNVKRLANTSQIYMPYVLNYAQLIQFDLEGIGVSAGSACSSGKITNSHVLKAIGLEDKKISNCIRVSLGPTHTQGDIDNFVKIWNKIYVNRQQTSNAHV